MILNTENKSNPISRTKWGGLRRHRSQAGVTLIEMLVVATIISLFSALVFPNLLSRVDRDRVTAARAQINGLMTALAAYKLDTGTFPSTELGLAALRAKPTGAADAILDRWNGPYLPQAVPNDPWGHPYRYAFPGSDQPGEPGVVSFGADGKPGGEGIDSDIVSWRK